MEKPIQISDNIRTESPNYSRGHAKELWRSCYLRVKSKIMYWKITEANRSLERTMKSKSISLVQVKISIPIFIIHPESRVKYIWNCVLVLLLIYTATITPFRICFMEYDTLSSWWWADTTVDFLFFLDVIINVNSAYFDQELVLETSRKRIFIRYLKTWMVLDVSACIPFNLIESSNQSLIKLVRLLRLYRLFRIFRLLKAFKKAHQSEDSAKLKEGFALSTATRNLIEFLIKTLIAIHVISCFWYFSAKLNNFDVNTWVTFFGYEDLSLGDLYLRSFYWAFSTLSTVGYGDIYPVNNSEIVITISWTVFGLCFFSYTLGVLSSMFLSQNSKEMALNSKLLVVDEFIKEEKLPRSLKISMKEALVYSNEKTGFSWSDKQNVFNELPAELRYEVAVKMHSGAINGIEYFIEKDKVFIATIVPFLKNMHSVKGEYIYHEGDYASDIFFILNGHLSLLCYEIPVKICMPGKYFGDIEILDSSLRITSAFCTSSIQLLTMGKDVVSFIQEEFLAYSKEMLANSKIKKEKILIFKEKIDIFRMFKQAGTISNKTAEQIKSMIDKELRGNESREIKGKKANAYEKIVESINNLERSIKDTKAKLIESLELSNDLLEFTFKC